MCTACALHVHCMCTACAQRMHCMCPTCLFERRGRLRLTQVEEGEAGGGKVRGACQHVGRGEAPGVPGVHLPALANLQGVRVAAAARNVQVGILRWREHASVTMRARGGGRGCKGREAASLEEEAVPRQPELVGVGGEAQEVVCGD
eukprot:scaffold58447_cov66-Phaeocystis_antarctica.AAC.1